MELSHGGDWAGYEREYGLPLLDFSANVSPLGLPENVRQAVVRALDTADRYPDPLCRELREKLSERHGVPVDWILCGNGASDLIYRLALAKGPRTALVTAPACSSKFWTGAPPLVRCWLRTSASTICWMRRRRIPCWAGSLNFRTC